jgi:hypothetical protein
MKMLVLLLTGVGLFPAASALSAKDDDRARLVPARLTVELRGKLHHVQGELERLPPIPFDYWELLVDGRTYYLDLGTEELRAAARNLDGGIVTAKGFLALSSPTLRVTALKAVEYVHVEIKGKLSRELRILPSPALPNDERDALLQRDRIDLVWVITADGKTYDLSFDGASPLVGVPERLEGKAVIVTGTPVGFAIRVTGLKADDSGTTTEKATVEARGQVKRGVAGDVFSEAYACWSLTIDGETYELDFGALKDLAEMATALEGKQVVVSGVIEVIPPRQLAEVWSIRPRERLRLPGKKVIHVAGLKVA